ncbi:MAG: diacylglycerol/lipid kinase family protein [Pirellula sp.]
MSLPRSVLISANPRSGATSGLERAGELKQALDAAGFAAELFTDIDAFTRRSRELHAAGELRAVVSAGGDGTASLVLSKIPAGVPVALFPLGSENLLAKYFQSDRDIAKTAAALREMRTVPLDLFTANGQLTLLVTSVGYDAEVVRIVHQSRKSHVTRWAYWRAIFQAIGGYTWPTLEVELRSADGTWSRAGECNWLFAFNVPRYAAGIQIVDSADIDDGLLEIGMFQGGKLVRGMWHYGMVAGGMHTRSRDWRRERASGVRVRCLASCDAPRSDASAPPVSYQIDGDWGGGLPLEIVVADHQARIVVGSSPS